MLCIQRNLHPVSSLSPHLSFLMRAPQVWGGDTVRRHHTPGVSRSPRAHEPHRSCCKQERTLHWLILSLRNVTREETEARRLLVPGPAISFRFPEARILHA